MAGCSRTTASGSLYRSGLALLDLEEPNIVLHRSDDWVLGPAAPYERAGDVADIVFPCGWVHDEATGVLRVYYGAADTSVAVATARLSDVLAYVKSCPLPQHRRHSDQD